MKEQLGRVPLYPHKLVYRTESYCRKIVLYQKLQKSIHKSNYGANAERLNVHGETR